MLKFWVSGSVIILTFNSILCHPTFKLWKCENFHEVRQAFCLCTMMQICQKIILIIHLSHGCVPVSCASSVFDTALCAWQCILCVSAHVLRAFRSNWYRWGCTCHITALFQVWKEHKTGYPSTMVTNQEEQYELAIENFTFMTFHICALSIFCQTEADTRLQCMLKCSNFYKWWEERNYVQRISPCPIHIISTEKYFQFISASFWTAL